VQGCRSNFVIDFDKTPMWLGFLDTKAYPELVWKMLHSIGCCSDWWCSVWLVTSLLTSIFKQQGYLTPAQVFKDLAVFSHIWFGLNTTLYYLEICINPCLNTTAHLNKVVLRFAGCMDCGCTDAINYTEVTLSLNHNYIHALYSVIDDLCSMWLLGIMKNAFNLPQTWV